MTKDGAFAATGRVRASRRKETEQLFCQLRRRRRRRRRRPAPATAAAHHPTCCHRQHPTSPAALHWCRSNVPWWAALLVVIASVLLGAAMTYYFRAGELGGHLERVLPRMRGEGSAAAMRQPATRGSKSATATPGVHPKWVVPLPPESAAVGSSGGTSGGAASAPAPAEGGRAAPRLELVVSFHQEPLERVAADVARLLEVPTVKALAPRVHLYVKGGPVEPVQQAMPWAHAVEALPDVGRSAHVSHGGGTRLQLVSGLEPAACASKVVHCCDAVCPPYLPPSAGLLLCYQQHCE